jgi:quercetin dioxygenase-like cupin family protein
MAVIHRFLGDHEGLDWEGVPLREYGDASLNVKGASRRILIGRAEESDNLHVRYFEVQPGGYTLLDQHPHEHGVIMLRGWARVRLGDEETELGYGDVLYIPGNEIHQFFCVGDEPMGFLCVVSAKR